MSDRGTAILPALNKHFKKAFLKPCPKHIEGNLKKLGFSADLINLYWKATTAKTELECDLIHNEIATKPKGDLIY